MIVRSAHAASRKTSSAATKRTGPARMASPKKSSDRWARMRNSHHTVPTAMIARPAHISHCAARTAPAFTILVGDQRPGGKQALVDASGDHPPDHPDGDQDQGGERPLERAGEDVEPLGDLQLAEEHHEGAQGHEEAHEEGQGATHPDAAPEEDDREQVEPQPEGTGDAQPRPGKGAQRPDPGRDVDQHPGRGTGEEEVPRLDAPEEPSRTPRRHPTRDSAVDPRSP